MAPERDTSRRVPSRDQFAGCLVGQCLGGALGLPVEGEGPPDARAYARDVVLRGLVPAKGGRGFAFGQYAESSQLAREMMLSWRECRGFDAADFAGRIAGLYSGGWAVGGGGTTSRAAQALARGVPWQAAGIGPPAAGNGSAMRAAPLGLLLAGDQPAMIRAALDQSRITHRDPRCLAGSVVVAGAVALATARGPLDPARFLGRLRDWAGPVEPTFASALRRLEGWLDLEPPEAAEAITHDGTPPGVDSQWRGGMSAFVVASVLWGLYAFLRSPDDYLGAVAGAIEAGGDTDTVAALAGALAGARLGLAGLPERLARKVNDRGEWGYDALVRLAQDCGGV